MNVYKRVGDKIHAAVIDLEGKHVGGISSYIRDVSQTHLKENGIEVPRNGPEKGNRLGKD